MANESPLNRKEMIKEGTLEHHKGIKDTVTKSIGIYNRHSFS